MTANKGNKTPGVSREAVLAHLREQLEYWKATLRADTTLGLDMNYEAEIQADAEKIALYEGAIALIESATPEGAKGYHDVDEFYPPDEPEITNEEASKLFQLFKRLDPNVKVNIELTESEIDGTIQFLQALKPTPARAISLSLGALAHRAEVRHVGQRAVATVHAFVGQHLADVLEAVERILETRTVDRGRHGAHGLEQDPFGLENGVMQ